MDPRVLTPVLLGLVLVWAVIRRIRRSVGRQSVQPKRLIIRISLLAVVGAALLLASLHDWKLAGSLLLGAAAGVALGGLGLRHTIFEQTTEGRFYTPHTYIGLLVTLLFLGRLVYRFVLLNHGGMMPSTGQDPVAFYQRSPLTLGLFGLLVGYYLVYNIGVLNGARYPGVSGAT